MASFSSKGKYVVLSRTPSDQESEDEWPRDMDRRFSSPIEMLSSPRMPDSPVS